MTAGKVPGNVLHILAGVMCFSLNNFLWPKDRIFLLTRCEPQGNSGVEENGEEGIIYFHTTWTEAKREAIVQKKIVQHGKEITAITCAHLINSLQP